MDAWHVEPHPKTPTPETCLYVATRNGPEGHEVVRVTMAWPLNPLQSQGLRLRAEQVKDPQASAWRAVADKIDAGLQGLARKEGTRHD